MCDGEELTKQRESTVGNYQGGTSRVGVSGSSATNSVRVRCEMEVSAALSMECEQPTYSRHPLC